jgi:molybdopterin-guanine dinucleotide biosynthesis protein A
MPPRYSYLAAAILAGGKGRRMGGVTKAFIEVDGDPIIHRQLDVLRQLATDICIVADDPAPFSELGIAVLPDRVPDSGPLGGLAAALAWSEAPWLLAVASDMPYLSVGALSVLADACGEAVDDSVDIVSVSRQPLCAVYSVRCLDVLDRRLAARDLRVSGLLEADDLRTRLVPVEAFARVDRELRFLSNINSPADLEP